MDSQRFDPTVRQTSLRVFIPHAYSRDDDAEGWRDPLPSPPPPSPCNARRETPYDTQRFDPYRVMVPMPTPHFTTPTSPEFAINQTRDYPALLNSVIYKLPPYGMDDTRAGPVDDVDSNDLSDESSADISLDSVDSGIATPGDELSGVSSVGPFDTPVCAFTTTYHFEGVEENGPYEINRTIVRSGSRSRLRSLAHLPSRTLRSMSSFARGSGSGSRSGASTPSDGDFNDATDGVIAPPASRLESRRPSLAPASCLAPSLSSPVSPAEVMRSLRKIASTLSLADCTGHAVERHFEESIDYYEQTWSLASGPGAEERMRLEVCVTRTETVMPVGMEEEEMYLAQAQVRGRLDSVGLYAAPRERKTSLQAVAKEGARSV